MKSECERPPLCFKLNRHCILCPFFLFLVIGSTFIPLAFHSDRCILVIYTGNSKAALFPVCVHLLHFFLYLLLIFAACGCGPFTNPSFWATILMCKGLQWLTVESCVVACSSGCGPKLWCVSLSHVPLLCSMPSLCRVHVWASNVGGGPP